MCNCNQCNTPEGAGPEDFRPMSKPKMALTLLFQHTPNEKYEDLKPWYDELNNLVEKDYPKVPTFTMKNGRMVNIQCPNCRGSVNMTNNCHHCGQKMKKPEVIR